MNFTADSLIIAGTVAGLAVVTCLFISVIWGIQTRQQLLRARRQLRERDAEMRALVDARRQLAHASHQKDIALSTRNAGLHNLKERLQEKLEEIVGLKSELGRLDSHYNQQRRENRALQVSLQEREDRHSEQLALLKDTRETLKQDFENLANRIFDDKGRHFNTSSKASLEALLQPFREQVNAFQSRINEVHSESVKGNTALEAEIRKVLDIGLEMNTQAGNLASALKGDKKTAGNWGEAQLERTLELAGLQAGDHYETQASFRDEDGRLKLPDLIVKLPGDKQLIIDSKVSLVDYDRSIAAETETERSADLAAHAMAVRHHIDDLAGKDYTRLPGIVSPDFVLMFMPVEPAYIEALKHNKELFNYGYQQGVVMVSHTTLMPILRTISNLWMIDRSNREAREISGRAGDIYSQVCLVAQRLNKLGNTLKAANNHYNDTVKALAGKQGLHGKVERFAQFGAGAGRDLIDPEPIHVDVDNDRLDSLKIDTDNTAEPKASGSEGQAILRPIKTDS